MLFWVKAVGFENTAQFQGSEIPPRLFQYFMVFVSGITQGELGGRGSPRFPCVTLVVESFSSDLPRAIVSYWAESHLESCEDPRRSSTTGLHYAIFWRTNIYKLKCPYKIFLGQF